MSILVTGGAGYIGSHTVVELLDAGYDVVVIDNLCNSARQSLERVERITGRAVAFFEGDVRDTSFVQRVIEEQSVDAVIHFAALKAVGESMHKPLEYFDNNISGSLSLFNAMRQAGVFNLVFSSSATVYGDPGTPVFCETMETGHVANNYGYTKLMVEQIIERMSVADERWNVAMLRYFNPVGAHESGLIGEAPNGIPNNLVPYIAQVAVGQRECLSVFGGDYDTPDGTCQRDYIHVVDLAKGHLCALEKLTHTHGVNIWNLGGGQPSSVLEVITAFEQASGKTIPYTVEPRRAGDLARFWADPSKAAYELGWKTQRTLDDMMKDMWQWQSTNPNGYDE